MKISRDWLQTFFSQPLPDAEKIGHALTFHAFEIESIENDVLDVKVTANRGHDCLSYRGIARELSAILKIPLVSDPHSNLDIDQKFSGAMPMIVSIADTEGCYRFIAWSIKGVKVAPSPQWLVDRLASMGQASINNVVDITNFVMFNLGQPLHAFDARQLSDKDGYAITVRRAKNDEKILALDDKEYTLKDTMMVVTDAHTDKAIGIAGVKGGKPAGISESTTDIIIESANFNGVSVRRTAAALKLRTDASARFEQVISPEMAAEGVRMAAKYILELAGGELGSFADEYPKPAERTSVSVTLAAINKTLGTALAITDAEDALTRLGLSFTKTAETLTVSVPLERLDLITSDDIIEEVGRIVGYDKVPSTPLSAFTQTDPIHTVFASEEQMREKLMNDGYSEVITSVFVDAGERAVQNKVDSVHPYLRANLTDGLTAAYEKNVHHKDVLGITEIKLFEIGTVWRDGKEIIMVGTADKKGVREEELAIDTNATNAGLPLSTTLRYQTFSKYPAIVRDIALWVPSSTTSADVLGEIKNHAGELLVRIAQFDEFKKGDKTSFAFRLVFQSFDRTLFDGDANERMESVYVAVRAKGWEVR